MGSVPIIGLDDQGGEVYPDFCSGTKLGHWQAEGANAPFAAPAYSAKEIANAAP
jgi:hypothetical protein